MTTSSQDRACQFVDQLAANGATFDFRPANGTLPASFNYALPRGGDRWRCRGIVIEAKTDPNLWREFVAEIGRRCNGGSQ